MLATKKKRILAASTFLVALSVSPAFARPDLGPPERLVGKYWEETAGIESNGNWAAQNGNSTAHGIGQMLVSSYAQEGVVQAKPEYSHLEKLTSWDQVEFTDKARSFGVNNYHELGNTMNGKRLQEQALIDYTRTNWENISGVANQYSGQQHGNMQMSDAGMLSVSHFLGSGGFNTWAESGFTKEGLANLNNLDAIFDQNHFSTLEGFQDYLEGRMNTYKDVDISEITNGTGGGSTVETTTTVACEGSVEQALNERARQYVEKQVMDAQDETLGYSQMQEPFGQLSCIDFAFQGGLDILFSGPSIGDIQDKAMNMACSQVNSMVAEATSGMSEAFQQASQGLSGSTGMGPFGNIGVQSQFNPNSQGVNIGRGVMPPPSGNGGGGIGGGGFSGGQGGPVEPGAGHFTALFKNG